MIEHLLYRVLAALAKTQSTGTAVVRYGDVQIG